MPRGKKGRRCRGGWAEGEWWFRGRRSAGFLGIWEWVRAGGHDTPPGSTREVVGVSLQHARAVQCSAVQCSAVPAERRGDFRNGKYQRGGGADRDSSTRRRKQSRWSRWRADACRRACLRAGQDRAGPRRTVDGRTRLPVARDTAVRGDTLCPDEHDGKVTWGDSGGTGGHNRALAWA